VRAGDADRIGAIVRSEWRLDAVLGVGGMATVFAATSVRDGRRAALKILHVDYARDKAVCERFLREANVASRVQHPAVVAALADGTTEEGEPFLVMELLERVRSGRGYGRASDGLRKEERRRVPRTFHPHCSMLCSTESADQVGPDTSDTTAATIEASKAKHAPSPRGGDSCSSRAPETPTAMATPTFSLEEAQAQCAAMSTLAAPAASFPPPPRCSAVLGRAPGT
jgi:hypothetical protein